VLFGKSTKGPCEQSLFLIKWQAIPWFVGQYLHFPGDGTMLCEEKFTSIMAQNPATVGYHGIGPGRDRPLHSVGARSAQQLAPHELSAFLG